MPSVYGGVFGDVYGNVYGDTSGTSSIIVSTTESYIVSADGISVIPELDSSAISVNGGVIVRSNDTKNYAKIDRPESSISTLNNRILYKFGRHRKHD